MLEQKAQRSQEGNMTHETHMTRLESLSEWADGSGYSFVTIRPDDLAWAVDRLRLLESILGEDMDLDGALSDPAPIEHPSLDEQE
jgi:hypothetical protein